MASHDSLNLATTIPAMGQDWLHNADARTFVQIASMFEESDALIGAYDPDDILRGSNRAWRSALHIGPDEHPSWADTMRRNYQMGRGTRIETSNFDKWLSSAASRRAKLKSRTFETDLLDGRWLLVQENTHPSGWLLCVACDITQLRTSERSLRVDRDGALIAAQTDELTGISNRRHIMGLLETMQSGTNGRDCGGGYACLIDIDFFKAVNDTYGHQMGDDVLVSVAQSMRRSIRTCDSLGRVGGEEFLLLIATTSEATAIEVLSRVILNVNLLRPFEDHPACKVTISGGIAPISEYTSPNIVYAQCDRQLYRAKHEGRNQFCMSGGSVKPPT